MRFVPGVANLRSTNSIHRNNWENKALYIVIDYKFNDKLDYTYMSSAVECQTDDVTLIFFQKFEINLNLGLFIIFNTYILILTKYCNPQMSIFGTKLYFSSTRMV